MTTPTAAGTVLEVRGLKKYFPLQRGVFKRTVGSIPAVDDVSFTLHEGETLGVVGESGCGKTTMIRSIIRATDPTAGEVLFKHADTFVDMARLQGAELKQTWERMRMIFQDPNSSLNPRMTVADIIAEPIMMHGVRKSKRMAYEMAAELMTKVGLNALHIRHYPHAFSGGQRQRIVIARALSSSPKLLLADEPTSALDVSVQSQILNLLMTLQKEMNLSFIYVSHDLRVVRLVSDSLAVMYLGKFVEYGRTGNVYEEVLHPYTQALMSAIPDPDIYHPMQPILLRGEIPDASARPEGCAFHPRCAYAVAGCRANEPRLESLGAQDHQVACTLAAEIRAARPSQPKAD